MHAAEDAPSHSKTDDAIGEWRLLYAGPRLAVKGDGLGNAVLPVLLVAPLGDTLNPVPLGAPAADQLGGFIQLSHYFLSTTGGPHVAVGTERLKETGPCSGRNQ